MTRVLVIAIVVAVAGCSSSSELRERFVAEAEGFSLEPPLGWTPQRDRGAVIFVSAEDPRRTLAIRSVILGDPEAHAKAVHATGTVVAHLPAVEITATRSVESPMRGVVYELTFVPSGSRERYARTHATLVGDQHLYHIIETRPAAGAKNDGAVQAVIASLREEG